MTVTFRVRFTCPACHRPVGTIEYPDAVECEDDDGWIVRYHRQCWEHAMDEPEGD